MDPSAEGKARWSMPADAEGARGHDQSACGVHSIPANPNGCRRKAADQAPRPTKAPPTGRCPFGWVWDEQNPDEVLV